MGILDFFRGVDLISPADARALLDREAPNAVQLVDVRTEKEYAREHLPGARNIPVDNLDERMKDLAADRTVVVY